MATLPQFQNNDKDLQLLQNKWAAILNPIIASPINSNNILKNVKLSTGVNTIDHLLQRPLIGWIVVGINAQSDIYDLQANNQTPQLTLKLNSSAACIVNLLVF